MNEGRKKTIIVGITGASGAIYARTLLTTLAAGGHNVHLLISANAAYVAEKELSLSGFSGIEDAGMLFEGGRLPKNVRTHEIDNLAASISSGSVPVDGMVVAPCSMKTLGAIASGYADSLLTRCADVTLKERRPLILMARETPLNSIHLANMLELSRAGATILPAAPPFYFNPQSLQDLADYMTMKVLDLLGIDHAILTRWNPGRKD